MLLHLIEPVSNSQEQTGRLVSIGEINATAQKDMDKSFYKPCVWQISDSLVAVFRTYQVQSDKTRGKLPLKKIWAPVAVG